MDLDIPHYIAITVSIFTVLSGIVAKKGFSSLAHLLSIIPGILEDKKVTKAELKEIFEASRGIIISILMHTGFVPKRIINLIDESIDVYEDIDEAKSS